MTTLEIPPHELFDLELMAATLSRRLEGVRNAQAMGWDDACARLIESTRLATEIANILHERTEGRAL